MATVVVTDQVLETLARSGRPLPPCLSLAVVAKKPCNCRGRTHQVTVENLESVKVCITRLSPDELTRLKAAMGADRLVIHLKVPGLPARVVL